MGFVIDTIWELYSIFRKLSFLKTVGNYCNQQTAISEYNFMIIIIIKTSHFLKTYLKNRYRGINSCMI